MNFNNLIKTVPTINDNMVSFYFYYSKKYSVYLSLTGFFSDDDTKIVLTPGKLGLIKL